MIRALSEKLQDEYDRIVDAFCNQSEESDLKKFFYDNASEELRTGYEKLYKEAEELRSQGIMI